MSLFNTTKLRCKEPHHSLYRGYIKENDSYHVYIVDDTKRGNLVKADKGFAHYEIKLKDIILGKHPEALVAHYSGPDKEEAGKVIMKYCIL